ncbi:MAG: hypothetical protein LBS11_00365 [Oscillospiraceae bacterium]|nr:hypothetical protein [Oscillospiraceae bacterium]
MSKLKNMRAIEIPRFRAVSSGVRPLDELFSREAGSFDSWVNAHRGLIRTHIYEPQDFLWHGDGGLNTGKSTWIVAVNDGVTEADTAPYDIVEFPGGMFLVATGDEKDNDDLEETIGCMLAWIDSSDVFERGDLPGMCNMPNPGGAIDAALGIAQQQIYWPLKFRQR